jgi:hypothetical protein
MPNGSQNESLISFATVGIADTGFIFFVLVPSHAPVWPGILGPVF